MCSVYACRALPALHLSDHACRCVTRTCAQRAQVTPVIQDNGDLEYQAASPDEVALVKWTGVCTVPRVFDFEMHLQWYGGWDVYNPAHARMP